MLLALLVGCFALQPEQEFEAFQFLVDNMPIPDASDPTITADFLMNTVKLALTARSETKWAQQVPWDIFLNYVLPYASLNERRDPWRELFHKSFISLVNTTKSISEAVQVLNRDIWTQHGWNITFVPNQTPYSLAVFDVISHGNASCSGLSIFLVSACRSVGIPARVVGTPHWHRNSSECPHGDEDDNCGNHDWVEIWDGKWYFTGAHEYTTAGLDNAWFYPYPAKYQTPQSGNHSIYGTSWLRTSLSFPMVWDVNNSYISAVDVTANYLN